MTGSCRTPESVPFSATGGISEISSPHWLHFRSFGRLWVPQLSQMRKQGDTVLQPGQDGTALRPGQDDTALQPGQDDTALPSGPDEPVPRAPPLHGRRSDPPRSFHFHTDIYSENSCIRNTDKSDILPYSITPSFGASADWLSSVCRR